MDPAIGPSASERHLSPKILVVDDEVRLGELIVSMLRHQRMVGNWVTESSHALQQLRSGARVDAVVLDHGVAESDAVFRAAKSRGIPVVLISGDTFANDDRAFDELPDRLFLPKPFSMEQIADALRSVLNA